MKGRRKLKPKVIVIVGPTASGKTALSIELAKKINGEIVSCDSMQIYKDMNIGSAKPTQEEMEGIKHYLIDVARPDERFSVAEYKKQAEKAIEEILLKGKIPIVIGGTGLYADSLIYGIEYQEIEFDEKYRKALEIQAQTEDGLKMLYNQAKKIDEEAIKKQETRRYAKRQLTWFRKNKETIWLDGQLGNENNINIILEEINWANL